MKRGRRNEGREKEGGRMREVGMGEGRKKQGRSGMIGSHGGRKRKRVGEK